MERAERGEVPGGGPGRKMIPPHAWRPASRTQFPPKGAYLDTPTGQLGFALHTMWDRAWEENGESWQGMFGFCEESGESKNR
eukprot:11239366-Alexandrium_andersonii.AAC.1